MKTPAHHASSSTLLAFAAMSLSAAHSALLSKHIEMCPVCRHTIEEMSHLLGALLDSIEPEPLPEEMREDMMQRLLREPASNAASQTWAKSERRSPDVQRFILAEGVYASVVVESKGRTDAVLYEITVPPGASLPLRQYSDGDLLFVAKGRLKSSDGVVYEPGDLREGSDNASQYSFLVTSDEPAQIFLATESRLKSPERTGIGNRISTRE